MERLVPSQRTIVVRREGHLLLQAFQDGFRRFLPRIARPLTAVYIQGNLHPEGVGSGDLLLQFRRRIASLLASTAGLLSVTTLRPDASRSM